MPTTKNAVKAPTIVKLSQAATMRLEFIDFRLEYFGTVSRKEISEAFGLALIGATRDIAAYSQIAQRNIELEGARKIYVRSKVFKPAFQHLPEKVYAALSTGNFSGLTAQPSCAIPFAMVPTLGLPPLDVLAVVTRSIHQQRSLRVTHLATEAEPSLLEVVPHAIWADGQHWHLRGFNRSANIFIDLGLHLLERPELLPASKVEAHEKQQHDDQWNRVVELTLRPHPQHPFPKAVAHGYCMADDMIAVKVRAPLAGPTLRQLRVDCSVDSHLDPSQHQLALMHPDKVLYGIDSAIDAPGFRMTN